MGRQHHMSETAVGILQLFLGRGNAEPCKVPCVIPCILGAQTAETPRPQQGARFTKLSARQGDVSRSINARSLAQTMGYSHSGIQNLVEVT